VVSRKKIEAYGDPRLYALNLVSEKLAGSEQPLVPERLFVMGGEGGADAGANATGLLGRLLAMLLAEHAGLDPAGEASSSRGSGVRAATDSRTAAPPTPATRPNPVTPVGR
jgi:hypothetical protein